MTGFEGAGAISLYMAVGAALNHWEPHSLDAASLAIYHEIINVGVNNYFNGWNIAMCMEFCPTTGRPHIHATINSSTMLSRKRVQDQGFRGWDIRPMRGSKKQARDYCIKGGGLVIYIGDSTIWDENEVPLVRRAPINWQHVFACCQICTTFATFRRRFIDQGDEDCTRAFINKPNVIMQYIASNPPRVADGPHLLTLWQKNMVTLCSNSPVTAHRKIYWIWSSESGTGKSSIADICIRAGLPIFVWPADATIKDAVNMYDDQPVVVFDVPRDGRIDTLYPVLETVSDQRLVSSGKYNGKVTRFFAHTIVCSNMAPDHDRLPGRIDEIHVKTLQEEEYEVGDVMSQLSFE